MIALFHVGAHGTGSGPPAKKKVAVKSRKPTKPKSHRKVASPKPHRVKSPTPGINPGGLMKRGTRPVPRTVTG